MRRIIQKLAAVALSGVLAIVLLFAPAMSATAKNWNDGTATWSPGTWSPAGPPVGGEAVNIVFTDGTPRTVTLNVSPPSLGLLTIDLTGAGTGASTLSMPNNNNLAVNGFVVGGYSGITSSTTAGRGAATQSAGTVTLNAGWDFTVGYGAGSMGDYSLSGTGAVVANHSEFIGLAGNGTFNHSAGSNTITAGANHFFRIGTSAGSTGTYNLSGTGALIVNTSEYVGDAGRGFFNQTGGTNTVSGTGNNLYLGYNGPGGTYTLSAGALSVSSGIEYIGFLGTGNFSQSGGTNTAGNLYLFAASTYALSGGTLTCNSSEYVEDFSAFNQTGGTNNIANSLYIGAEGAGTTYYLGGTGSLSTVDEIIGAFVGVESYGTMIQTGGTHTVTGLLRVSEDRTYGEYTLSAGQASINSMIVGTSTGNSAGVVTVSGTGVLNVDGILTVYNGTFTPDNAHTSLRLSGGTINTAALNLGGTLSLLDWTAGTLNLTQSVTWDSAAVGNSTSAAFGSALTLGSNRTLMVTGNETLGGIGAFDLTLNGGSTHTVTGGILINPNGSLTISGGTLSTSSLVVNGAFNFSRGTLGITGPAGLTIGAGGPLGSTVVMNAQQNLNVTNTVTINNGAYLAVAGGFSAGNLINNGDLVVINTAIDGPVVNNNKITVVGTVNFNGPVSGPGAFFGPGTAHFNGGLAPGASPADVSFEGSLALADSNTLFIELGGITPGSQYDRLTIAGSASLDGTLNLSLINGFTPNAGQQFTILTAGSILNNGFELAGPAASSFSLIVNSTSVILQAIGLAGDYNHSGVVDAADYVVWRKGLGPTYTQNVYNVWRANFGQTAGNGSGASANAAVPEPTTLVLLMLAAVGCRCPTEARFRRTQS